PPPGAGGAGRGTRPRQGGRRLRRSAPRAIPAPPGCRRRRTRPAPRLSAPRPCFVRRSIPAGGGAAHSGRQSAPPARPSSPSARRRRSPAPPPRWPRPVARSRRARPRDSPGERAWGSRSRQRGGSWSGQSRFAALGSPHRMVLFLHNRYRTTGGEERVVDDLLWLVRERLGEPAELLARASATLGRGRAAAGLLRGGLDADRVAAAVRRDGARVVHAHNLQPTLGWRALAAARAAGARVVLHLHQYRLVCAI